MVGASGGIKVKIGAGNDVEYDVGVGVVVEVVVTSDKYKVWG